MAQVIGCFIPLITDRSKSSYNDDLNCALDKNAAKIQVALHLHEVEITREAKVRIDHEYATCKSKVQLPAGWGNF